MKKPILAAVFNAIAPGIGYLYVGVRKKFAVLLVIGVIISGLTLLDSQSPDYFANEEVAYISPWEWASIAILAIAFGYDAYTEAKALKPRK